MRDFRDSKAMAQTLRATLAARGLKLTHSQSLELIAEVFGVPDWNTLSAAIKGVAPAEREAVSPYSAFEKLSNRLLKNALRDRNLWVQARFLAGRGTISDYK